MKIQLTIAMSSLACAVVGPVLAADDYPSRPIRIVYPYPAGGVSDLTHFVADKLAQRFRQPVVIETRPGASGSIGAEVVARAQPDGYTLIATPPPPLAINQSLFPKLAYVPAAFVPVTVIATMPNLLVANRQLPVSDVRELLAYAKAHPDRLSYASTGNGGTPHLTAEHFKGAGGVNIVHVPYQGISSAMPDLASGRVDIMFANLTAVQSMVAAGKLKVLAVASGERLPELPAVPTLQEALPGFVSEAWLALAAPPGTPQPIIDKLAAAVREVLQGPEAIERFRQFGANPIGNTPLQAKNFIREEAERWAEVIRASGIRPE